MANESPRFRIPICSSHELKTTLDRFKLRGPIGPASHLWRTKAHAFAFPYVHPTSSRLLLIALDFGAPLVPHVIYGERKSIAFPYVHPTTSTFDVELKTTLDRSKFRGPVGPGSHLWRTKVHAFAFPYSWMFIPPRQHLTSSPRPHLIALNFISHLR
jgi:hypothetical protein